MAGAPAMKIMAEAGLAQPAIKSLALSDAWLPGPNTSIDQAYPHNRLATHLAVPYVVFAPTADYWAEVNSIVGAKLDNVFRGTVDAKTALAQGDHEGQKRLDDILKQQSLQPFPWPVGVGIICLLLVAIIYWIFKPDLGKKLSRSQKADAKAGLGFAAPWIIGTLVFTMGPMLLSLLMSFTDWDFITPAKTRGLANYTEALSGKDDRFWHSLQITFIYTLVSVPLGLVIAMGLALLLNAKIRGVPVYRTLFYLPSLASIVASSLIFRRIFQPDGGLLNLILYGPNGKWRLPFLASLVGPHGKLPDWMGDEHLTLPALTMMSFWGVGAGMVILLAGLKAIPDFYYEAATIDGAGPLSKFKVITLPMVSPAIFFTLVTGLIGSFQVFTQVFVMTGGTGAPNNSTRVYMLHLYDAAFNNLRMGYSAALAWILFAIIFVVSMVQYRLNKVVYYEGADK